MATYKVAVIKVKNADILALGATTAIEKDIAVITGDTVTAISGVSMVNLDGVNTAIAVSYTV